VIIPQATEWPVPRLPALPPCTLCIAAASVVSAQRPVDLPNSSRTSRGRTTCSNPRAPSKTRFRRDGSATPRC